MEDFFTPEEPEEGSYDEWEDKVPDAVWEPSDDVKYGVGEACKDVGDVRTVEYVFECGEECD